MAPVGATACATVSTARRETVRQGDDVCRPDTCHQGTQRRGWAGGTTSRAGRNEGEIFRPSCREAEKLPPSMPVIRRGEGKGRRHRLPRRQPTALGVRSLTTGPPSANLTQDARLPLLAGEYCMPQDQHPDTVDLLRRSLELQLESLALLHAVKQRLEDSRTRMRGGRHIPEDFVPFEAPQPPDKNRAAFRSRRPLRGLLALCLPVGTAPHPQALAVRQMQDAVVVPGPTSLEEGRTSVPDRLWGRCLPETPHQPSCGVSTRWMTRPVLKSSNPVRAEQECTARAGLRQRLPEELSAGLGRKTLNSNKEDATRDCFSGGQYDAKRGKAPFCGAGQKAAAATP